MTTVDMEVHEPRPLKSVVVSVKVTPEQFKAISERAKQQGELVSAFIRNEALGRNSEMAVGYTRLDFAGNEHLKIICSKCQHAIPNPGPLTVLLKLCPDGAHRWFCEACVE